ncbi:hypothetical protein ACGF0J_32095 [Nonomuraea sp. NPDC047897]|uniref:hypothetical protein n=1 Tax=Nonomuraea sp. NPDC047897 TaxID=3364346 RepID=UPI00371C4CAB
MNTDVDRVVAHLDPGPGPGMTEGAHALMREIITAEPAPAPRPARRRRPVLRLALPGVALATAAFVALSWLLPTGPGFGPGPAAALDIREENGYYVVEVKDLYAGPDRYQEQLRGVGLDVTLRLTPSTPSMVGSIFPTSPTDHRYLDEIKTIDQPGACEKMGGCPIGVKVPVGFQGPAEITLGREAAPGEEYANVTSFDALGEPMHCVAFRGRTVAEVRELLAQRGLAVHEFRDTNPYIDEEAASRTSVPDSWYVNGGYLRAPGKANLNVSEQPEESDAGGLRNCAAPQGS